MPPSRTSRRHRWPALAAGVCLTALTAHAQEGNFLREDEAAKAVFPKADTIERRDVAATPALRDRVRERLGSVVPSRWEDTWIVFTASDHGKPLGCAVIVEEIGKHRPITFVVGVRPDGTVEDVAVMAYREAYGGEIRSQRFLSQYDDKTPSDDLRPYKGIKNVAGATLSVEAAGRAVHKAQAVAAVVKETSS
jgi:Na+-translocating ferredoxin:NAD+ oxidoreductase RnfG subunit